MLLFSWLLLALQVKVGKVASFVGKIFVLQCPRIFAPQKLPAIRYEKAWARLHLLFSTIPVYLDKSVISYVHYCTVMQVQMGPLEVINITAIAGDKGHSHAYQCQDNTNGTNILSSVFQPQDKIMVSGRGLSSLYLKGDLSNGVIKR